MSLESRGTITFDDLTEEDFKDLVEQTLEQSEFITLDWTGPRTAVVYERVE